MTVLTPRKSSPAAESSLRTRLRFVRRFTLGVVFVTVALWGAIAYREDQQVFAWNKTILIRVVPLVDALAIPRKGEVAKALRARLTDGEIESWLTAEFERYGGQLDTPFEFVISELTALEEELPQTPNHDASILTRTLESTQAVGFFDRFSNRASTNELEIFVVFYDALDRDRRDLFQYRDSFASRRHRRAIVFAPLHEEVFGNTLCVLAHELCHLFGAKDKYDGKHSIYPDGYVEPARSPRYPQDFAEIMALKRPVSKSAEEDVESLETCRVGKASAIEMNWRP